MKAIWKGSIAFGLVNIPVSACLASEEHTLEFHMLHKKDLSLSALRGSARKRTWRCPTRTL